MVVQMYTANRMQLSHWFDRELTALPPEARERTLNALAMALAPESWVVLRQRLGLTVEQARASLSATNPQGRFIQPQEVAAAVLWLCSAEAGSITGQALSLSGGETW